MKRLIVAVIAALALLTSCSLHTDQLYLPYEYLMAPQMGGTYTLDVYSNGTWTAQVNAPTEMTMSVNPAGGSGNGSVTITVAPFDGSVDYMLGYIVFDCGNCKNSFPVYQCSEDYQRRMEEQNPEPGI